MTETNKQGNPLRCRLWEREPLFSAAPGSMAKIDEALRGACRLGPDGEAPYNLGTRSVSQQDDEGNI